MAGLDATIGSVSDLFLAERDESTHSVAQRRMLQQRLAQIQKSTSREISVGNVGARQIAITVSVVFAIFAGLALLQIPRLKQQTGGHWAGRLPDRSLTPGDVRAISISEVCSADAKDNDPEVSQTLERRILTEYGVPEGTARQYQIDYLVSPQLGGTTDAKNLWPEPYSGGELDARAKDTLERRLQELVCEGKVPIEEAQHEIATDWVNAYKKYL
jgi:hypothetical protein